jgi:hypothetical protein
MCRNIRVLHNFVPPTTPEEIHAAALQYVRKVSGLNKPSHVNQEAFDRAIEDVAASTARLLAALPPHEPHRTREGEREKAKLRWTRRSAAFSR